MTTIWRGPLVLSVQCKSTTYIYNLVYVAATDEVCHMILYTLVVYLTIPYHTSQQALPYYTIHYYTVVCFTIPYHTTLWYALEPPWSFDGIGRLKDHCEGFPQQCNTFLTVSKLFNGHPCIWSSLLCVSKFPLPLLRCSSSSCFCMYLNLRSSFIISLSFKENFHIG